MKPNYIFGLTNKLISLSNNNIREGWIVNINSHDYAINMGINIGTPCIVIKYNPNIHKSINNTTSNRQVVLLPSTIQSTLPNRLILDTRLNTRAIVVKVGGKTSFFDDIQTINVGDISARKISKITSLVKNTAPTTLVVDNRTTSSNIVNELTNLFKEVSSKFKYSFNGSCAFNGRRRMIENDKSVLTITAMDIAQCVPAAHPDKIDGIMLYISTMYTETSKQEDRLVNSCEMTFYFSNYYENIYMIDGQRTACTKCTFSNITSLINKCEGYFEDIGKTGDSV